VLDDGPVQQAARLGANGRSGGASFFSPAVHSRRFEIGVTEAILSYNAIRGAAVAAVAGVLVFAAATQPSACSQHDSFWAHVYKPQRLEVQEPCVSVTGVVVDATAGKKKDGVRHESDGDSHGWLKLDPGQEKYLNAGNRADEGGNLVFEVQCLYKVTQADAIDACKGWTNPLKLLPVGTHVRMTGSWVKDDNHAKWFELHPVFSIEAVK